MAKRLFRKALSAPGLLRTARACFDEIDDPVPGRRFRLSDCLMSGLAVFGLKYASLLRFLEMLRRRVAQRMRTATLADDPEAVEAAADNVPDRGPGHRPDQGVQRQKQRSVRASGTNIADVAQDRLSDAARQRVVMRAPRQPRFLTAETTSRKTTTSNQWIHYNFTPLVAPV